jgi:hypothetical protein
MSEVHFKQARTSEEGVKLEECHFYGTSKKNQRIESWWGQLQKSLLWRWRVSIFTFYHAPKLVISYHSFQDVVLIQDRHIFNS